MAFISDTILDNGLVYAQSNGSRVDVCTSEPTTYAQATSTLTLGNKAVTVGAPENGLTDGRRVQVPPINDGAVTADGTATHWALTDGVGELLATGAMTNSQALLTGNTFSLDPISVVVRDAT